VTRRAFVVLLALLVCVASAAGAALSSRQDSTTLIVNKQIGDVRMAESEDHVTYDYGADCIRGCAGPQIGCVLGLSGCVGPVHRYRVEGGHLFVGYRNRDQRGRRVPARVVSLQTSSPNYETAGGIGVGTKIPYGSRFGVFRRVVCGPGDSVWEAGTSWRRPLWKRGRSRWWTRLYVDRGTVTTVFMYRGDVNLQGC
jgi:hypothetical protein